MKHKCIFLLARIAISCSNRMYKSRPVLWRVFSALERTLALLRSLARPFIRRSTLACNGSLCAGESASALFKVAFRVKKQAHVYEQVWG